MPVNLYYTQRVRGFQQESEKYTVFCPGCRQKNGSSTVCAVNEPEIRKTSATRLKKTDIAPIVYRPRKTIGGRNAGQSLLYTAGARISTGE